MSFALLTSGKYAMKILNTCMYPSEAMSEGRRRGFTLLELMVVVVIVGIFAAVAVPAVTIQLRERRTANAAQQVAMAYRLARMRAMGRGSAVLVKYESWPHAVSTNQVGELIVLEGIVGVGAGAPNANCSQLPAPSCTIPANRWTTTGLYQEIDRVSFRNNGSYEYLSMSMANGAGAAGPIEICFTPGGATMWKSANTPFQRLTDVPSISVRSLRGGSDLGPSRVIHILPNGVARVAI